MKRLALFAVLSVTLAATSGCCLFHGCCGGCGGYGGYGGCNSCPSGGCGYGAGYGGYPGAVYSPSGYNGTAMVGGVPVYTAGAPIVAPTTALAPINMLPTY